MKHQFVLKSVLFGLIAVLILSCGPTDTSYVLDVEGSRLDSETVVRRYRITKDFQKNETVEIEHLKQFIEAHLIENLLYQAEARDMGLLKDEKVKADLEREKKRILVSGNGPLFNKIVPKGFPVSEEEVEKLYENASHKVKIAQVLVNSPKQADELYQKLKNGADISELAYKYSVDLKSAAVGGIYKYFIEPGTMPATFDKAVFGLEKGQFTKPFQMGFQYHLVQVLEKEPIEKDSLEEEQEKLTTRLEDQKRRLHIEGYLAQLFAKYETKFDPDAVDAVLRVANFAADKRKLTEGNFKENELDMQLLTTTALNWTVNDFVQNYKKIPATSRMALRYPEDIFEFARGWIVRDLMYHEALDMKLDKSDEFLKAYKNAEDNVLRHHYQQRFVKAQAAVFESDIQEYMAAHQEELKRQDPNTARGYITQKLRREKYRKVRSERLQELSEKFDLNYNERALKMVQNQLKEIKAKAEAAKAKKATDSTEMTVPSVTADTTK